MIYRKWSLLTGTVAITSAVIGTVVLANYLFVETDPFFKPESRKQSAPPSSK